MKAFKGCTNSNCRAYKKIHYKKEDQFCVKCGQPLSFVCAECWKPMEEDRERYCISCRALKEQNREKAIENAKKVGMGAITVMSIVAGAVHKIGDNSDEIVKGAKKAADAGSKMVNLFKKQKIDLFDFQPILNTDDENSGCKLL